MLSFTRDQADGSVPREQKIFMILNPQPSSINTQHAHHFRDIFLFYRVVRSQPSWSEKTISDHDEVEMHYMLYFPCFAARPHGCWICTPSSTSIESAAVGIMLDKEISG
jgi:hypothetical protein